MKMSRQEHFNGNASHIDEETLAAFVKNSLDGNERALVHKHLQQCPHCFVDMAMLRKSLTERGKIAFQPAPRRFIREAKALVAPVPTSESVWQKVWGKINTIPLPEFDWKYAILAPVGVAILIVLFNLFQPKQTLENYSTGDLLIISKIDPLGFVGESDSVAYKGMKVELSEDEKNIIFTWPEVAGAKFYHLDLIVNGDRQRLTPPQGTQNVRFSYPLQQIQVKTKYVWEISGKLEDGRSFQARVSFIRRK